MPTDYTLIINSGSKPIEINSTSIPVGISTYVHVHVCTHTLSYASCSNYHLGGKSTDLIVEAQKPPSSPEIFT